MNVGKVLNPLTNRWVKVDGKIGKKIINEQNNQAVSPPKIRYIPIDIVKNVAKHLSPKTMTNLAAANKHYHNEIKPDPKFARKNGNYLLKFLQNLDTYFPLFNPQLRDRYNKDGFTQDLFTLYHRQDQGLRFDTLSLRLYKSKHNEKRVMLVTSNTHYARPKENIMMNYAYTDSMNYTGKKLSTIFTEKYEPEKYKDHVTRLLEKLHGISFGSPLLERSHKEGRKRVYDYVPISDDPLLKEWYDFVYKNKSMIQMLEN